MWRPAKRARLGLLAALGSGVLLVPVLLASPASATTGDWGFSTSGQTAPAGGTITEPNGFPRIQCIAGPCDFDPTFNFGAATQNGTTITTAVGTITDYRVGSTNSVIGTCQVFSSTSYVCHPTSSGTLGTGDYLGGSGFQQFVPASQAQGSTATLFSWSDAATTTGNDPSNDTYTITVAGTVEVPLLNPLVLGGAGGGLALLLATGYVLHRRRRTPATGLAA